MTERIDITAVERQIREEELEAVTRFIEGKGEAPQMYTEGLVVKAADDAGKPVRFIASHESPDRAGDSIAASGWDLRNFEGNPVVPWAHRYDLQPVGRALNTKVSGKSLLTAIDFDSENAFAADVERQVRSGFINAVSVGFRPLEASASDREGRFGMQGIDFTKSELLEISIVPVPMHARALRRALEDSDTQFYIQMPGLDFARDLHKSAEKLIVPQQQALILEATATTLNTLDAGSDTVKWNTWEASADTETPTLSQQINGLMGTVDDLIQTVRQLAATDTAAQDIEEDTEDELIEENGGNRNTTVDQILDHLRTVTATPSED